MITAPAARNIETDRRVARRRAPGVNHRTVLGRHVGGIENIFDRDRHAVQRPDRLTAQTERVGRARLRERVIGIEKRPGLNLRIDVANTRQASFDELFRADDTVADQARRFRRGEQMKIESKIPVTF